MMIQKKAQRRIVLSLCFTMISFGVGCTNKQAERMGMQSPAPSGHSARILVDNEATLTNVPVYREANGLVWIPLEETAKSMNYDLHYTNNRFTMGHTDSAYSVKVNETQALAGDKPVELPQAPRLFDSKPHVTTQALSALMGAAVNWHPQHSEIVITQADDRSLSRLNTASVSESSSTSTLSSLSDDNKRELIGFTETLAGTPYKFASGPYEATRTFDCSSLVQYVYNKFGVDLPRSSRSQAQVGQNVTVDQLKPGDLMFFSTPGRFASNRTVGHVGIYAGNGQIVHTYGAPGVTRSDFSAYWRNRFLFAKRVA